MADHKPPVYLHSDAYVIMFIAFYRKENTVGLLNVFEVKWVFESLGWGSES